MGWTTIHIHLDIKQFLAYPDEKLKGLLCDSETKENLTPDQVREFFISELRKGYDYFCSCNNRKKDGSCAGHPQLSEPEEITVTCKIDTTDTTDAGK